MSNPQHPVPGDLHVDASGLPVVDLTGKKTQSLAKLHAGYGAAIDNVLNQPPAMLARAGIDPGEVAALKASRAIFDRTEELRPATEKLAELVRETGYVHKAKVASGMNDLASQIKRRAKRDPNGDEILAAFAPLLEHVVGPANKAIATKIAKGTLKPKQPKKSKKTKPPAPTTP